MNLKVCDIAIKNGYLDIVKWAHNNGYEWQYCECYKKSKIKKGESECKYIKKSIKKWLKEKYNKEFNFIILS